MWSSWFLQLQVEEKELKLLWKGIKKNFVYTGANLLLGIKFVTKIWKVIWKYWELKDMTLMICAS